MVEAVVEAYVEARNYRTNRKLESLVRPAEALRTTLLWELPMSCRKANLIPSEGEVPLISHWVPLHKGPTISTVLHLSAWSSPDFQYINLWRDILKLYPTHCTEEKMTHCIQRKKRQMYIFLVRNYANQNCFILRGKSLGKMKMALLVKTVWQLVSSNVKYKFTRWTSHFNPR